MNSKLLYACSHCFKRFTFENLTPDNHYCKNCYEKTLRFCFHCFKRFSPKHLTQNYCNACQMCINQFGRPSVCKFCKLKTAFGNNKCTKCALKFKKQLIKCKCCSMEYEKKANDNGDIPLCWRCESTMQNPTSIGDSMELESVNSSSAFSSPATTFKPFEKDQNENGKEGNLIDLKLFEEFTQDDSAKGHTNSLAKKINSLEENLFNKSQELMGKDKEIILLKSKCKRLGEIEKKVEMLRKLDEDNKAIKKKNKHKQKHKKITKN